jgi:hypothetical protein
MAYPPNRLAKKRLNHINAIIPHSHGLFFSAMAENTVDASSSSPSVMAVPPPCQLPHTPQWDMTSTCTALL